MKTPNKKGFTMVELLAAVAIVGALAMVAYPEYQAHVVRGHRAEARVNLHEIASLQGIYVMQNAAMSASTITPLNRYQRGLHPTTS